MKKIHKYIGLVLLLIMIWMAVSGIILNHRKFFARWDISRNNLPTEYLYDNWNYGFFKGSVKLPGDSVLLYGNEGIWLTDIGNSFIHEMNNGIQDGADNRKISRIVTTPEGDIYCAGMYDIYRFNSQQDYWEKLLLPSSIHRITDMEIYEGLPVILTRSELLLYNGNGEFIKREIKPSPDLDNRRPLFRLIWTLHSGELFGTAGKIIVDILGLIVIFLSITGGMIWLLPKLVRRFKKQEKSFPNTIKTFRFAFHWHSKSGYWLTIPLLIIVITGACLRPPLLILLSSVKITPPPLTTLRPSNPWHDLLRSIRYDSEQREWLLYTSEGFFTIQTLEDTPRRMRYQAPVSVMGLNVWEQLDEEFWLIGSFNGFILWNRYTGEMFDGFTGNPYISRSGMPFGQHKVSGYSADLEDQIVLFLYDTGCFVFSDSKTFLPMPERLQSRPMSLWNLALEMHTGRLFTFLGSWSILYPFILGIISFLMLFSGWRVYRKRKKRK